MDLVLWILQCFISCSWWILLKFGLECFVILEFVNIESVVSFFPEEKKHNVRNILQHINTYLLDRITIDPKTFAVIIDNTYINNSNIVDILQFLYDVNQNYISQEKILVFSSNRRKYGIPTGIQSFVNVLQSCNVTMKISNCLFCYNSNN